MVVPRRSNADCAIYKGVQHGYGGGTAEASSAAMADSQAAAIAAGSGDLTHKSRDVTSTPFWLHEFVFYFSKERFEEGNES